MTWSRRTALWVPGGMPCRVHVLCQQGVRRPILPAAKPDVPLSFGNGLRLPSFVARATSGPLFLALV